MPQTITSVDTGVHSWLRSSDLPAAGGNASLAGLLTRLPLKPPACGWPVAFRPAALPIERKRRMDPISTGTHVLNIPLAELMPDPSQPRKTFLDEEIGQSLSHQETIADVRFHHAVDQPGR